MSRLLALALVALVGCGPTAAGSPDAPAAQRDRRPQPAPRRTSITPLATVVPNAERLAAWLIPAAGCSKGAAFGSAIAAADDRVLVTATAPELAADGPGDPPVACVFRRFEERFLLEGVLAPPAGALGRDFGKSALISGPHAAIGAGQAVHVFRSKKSGWELSHSFEPLRRKGARPKRVDYASSLALHEGELLVGVVEDSERGSVQVHSLSSAGGSPPSELTGTKADRAFGSALAIQGDRLAVGADARAGGTPSASLFVRDANRSWTLACRVESGEPGDRFGASVALGGDRIVVGVPHASVRGVTQAGRVDVFTISGRGCARTATLIAPSPRVRGFFGSSLDAGERALVVGEPGAGVEGSEAPGRVFLFDASGASVRFSRELSTQASRPADRLGSSVALGPDSVWASAPRAGAGYVIGSPLGEFGYLPER